MDVAIATYGDITGMLALIEDNSLVSLTEALIPGHVLYYNGSLDLSESNNNLTIAPKSTKKRYIVSSGQTLMDVAIEVYGDITGILRLLEDNPALVTIDNELLPGQLLRYDSSYSVNQQVVDFYAAKGLKVNTGEVVVTEEYLKVFSNIFNNIFG
jgi:hypothetical protein